MEKAEVLAASILNASPKWKGVKTFKPQPLTSQVGGLATDRMRV
jgi:hypothetical protein